MNGILHTIQQHISAALKTIWQKEVHPDSLQITPTRPEFEGDFTFVTFPLTKLGIGKPEDIGNALGAYLIGHMPEADKFNLVKGFLNLSLKPEFWTGWMHTLDMNAFMRPNLGKGRHVGVEFSSPNTNKPLHLGHLRNIFLGDSISRILSAGGYDVKKFCLYNDRGIAICKSMLMYQMEGKGETPAGKGVKPDFFVVDYYIRFGERQREQVAEALAKLGADLKDARVFMLGKKVFGDSMDEAEMKAAKQRVEAFIKEKSIDIDSLEDKVQVMQDARAMLLRWEAGDPETLALWKRMNDWVYEGFNATYREIGVTFDKIYYESETWMLGIALVEEGLQKGAFYRKDDGSVWVDLTGDGLDQKVLRRSDGTTMYITQDMGTAQSRADEFGMEKSIYVVGNEQEYHFKVLRLIMQKLGRPWADGIYHLSYGMVDLPAGMGRMKTREGTTVEADDLMAEVKVTALEKTRELGKVDGLSDEEVEKLVATIAGAALKYFILRVDPVKRMVFDPNESVNLHGDTGPFIQYTYARIASLMRNAPARTTGDFRQYDIHLAERAVLRHLYAWPAVMENAVNEYNPSLIAAWALDLAKQYNRFYGELPVLKAESETARDFRVLLGERTAALIRFSMELLSIHVPERM